MPRTKQTRNFLGTILPKKITKNGKRVTVYDVRKRYLNVDADGAAILNQKGAKTYKDQNQRCYSMSEAQAVLSSMPAKIQEKKAEKQANEKLSKVFTFFKLVENFRREQVKPPVFSGKKKIAGYKQNLQTINRYLDELKIYFGDVDIALINYDMCKNFKFALATTPTVKGTMPQPSTYHKKLSFLSKLLTIAAEQDRIPSNPMQKGEPLIQQSDEAPRNRMLTYDEEERLLNACRPQQILTLTNKRGTTFEQIIWTKREHLRPFLLLALDAAMRRGEVFNLRWKQIDFENRVIYLTEEAAAATKTGKEGILPMIPRLAEELLKIYQHAHSPGDNELVLGKRINFTRAFQSACRAAKIDNLQYRDLRATGATRMLLAGNASVLVQKITRHGNVETLREHYTVVDRANAQAVGDKLHKYNAAENAKHRKQQKSRAQAKVEVKVKTKYEVSPF